jgi:hypothetical protein
MCYGLEHTGIMLIRTVLALSRGAPRKTTGHSVGFLLRRWETLSEPRIEMCRVGWFDPRPHVRYLRAATARVEDRRSLAGSSTTPTAMSEWLLRWSVHL